jgi:signal peptidase II
MLRLILLITLPLYVLDVLTKNWIVNHFDLHGAEQTIVPNFFWLHHTANTGIAFGMFNGTEYANIVFGAVSLAALVLFTWFYRKGFFPGAISRLALSLLLAGIFGNLTDRLFRSPEDGRLFEGGLLNGYVVDFLKFDLHVPFASPWPSFNVADSCVVVAAILLAIASFTEVPAPEKRIEG